MSGLWTNDREFADKVRRAVSVLATGTEDSGDQAVLAVVHEITSRVRVLDPDDTELVNRIARVICYGTEPPGKPATAPEPWRRTARAVIEALRQL
jgi:hypothetical protein